MGRCAKALPPFPRAHPDGARAWHEPKETRGQGEPQAGTVEASSPRVHRRTVLQTLWEDTTGQRPVGRANGERQKAKTG